MRIFLSYASENRPRAEEIALALQGDGHEVFFDAAGLAGGEDYNAVIVERMQSAHLLVFLISPDAVQPGSYTLTELRLAQDRWPSPVGRVVPVMLVPTPMEAIPAYLRALTIFVPRGNAAAEVSAHVNRLASRRRPLVWAGAAAGLVLTVIVGLAAWALYPTDTSAARRPFVSTVEEGDFLTSFVMGADRTEYRLDPTARFPADRGDVVRIERLAFGTLPDGSTAFSVRLSVNNTTDDPIALDLTPRFFDLVDDQGRRAELQFFCCEATGETLAPGGQRVLHLIYQSRPGWQGKETTPGSIHFQVRGLLPLTRGTWSFRPLATAA